MKATDTIPKWPAEIAAERVDQCRAMLHIHGFLTESESNRVNARIEKWAAKDGVKRRDPRCACRGGRNPDCVFHGDEDPASHIGSQSR